MRPSPSSGAPAGAALLSLLLLAAPASAADGDGLRLTLRGPGTPYGKVEMEARERGATVTVRLTQEYGAPFGQRESMGLSTPAELSALWQALAVHDAFRLAPARARLGVTAPTTYTLELVRDSHRHAFTVTAPEQLADRRHAEVLRLVRAWVTALTGEPLFRDGRIAPEEAGMLRVETSPSGRVYLDEVLLAERTPLEPVRVPAGPHVLRVVTPDGRTSLTFDITVDQGKTTSLRLNLE